MANIKISELNELQKATGQDLLVIVDVANNETKKYKQEILELVEQKFPLDQPHQKIQKTAIFG